MRSSRAFAAAVGAIIALVWSQSARAQVSAQGFRVERLYSSAPGAGWVVMDALDMRGGLGGVMGLTMGYAHDPLRVEGAPVVEHRAFADFGFAATYDRWRLYLNMVMPLVIDGQSATSGGYRFTAPSVDPASNPDTLSDVRIGLDTRLFGREGAPLRLGAGAQLFVPNGVRSDYDTDHTYRAMARALVAGDAGRLTYAAHVGAHVRPLDDSPVPGSPRGSEFVFGAAAGARLAVRSGAAVVVGPEIFGSTALKSPFGADTTGVEALVSGRIEGTGDTWPQMRVKLGAGGGLTARFGAPEWRTVLSIEIFAR